MFKKQPQMLAAGIMGNEGGERMWYSEQFGWVGLVESRDKATDHVTSKHGFICIWGWVRGVA